MGNLVAAPSCTDISATAAHGITPLLLKAVPLLEHNAMTVHVAQQRYTRTQLHAFTISVLDGVEWPVLRSGRLAGGGNNIQYQLTSKLGEPQNRYGSFVNEEKKNLPPLSGIELQLFGSSYQSRLATTAYFFSYFTTLYRPLRLFSAECGLLSLEFSITLHQMCKLLNSERTYGEQLSWTELNLVCVNIQNTYLHGSVQHSCVLIKCCRFQSIKAVVEHTVKNWKTCWHPTQTYTKCSNVRLILYLLFTHCIYGLMTVDFDCNI
jgi:hypothetical protein